MASGMKNANSFKDGSLEERGSFDGESSLLESALINFEEKQMAEIKDRKDDIAKRVTALTESDSVSNNFNRHRSTPDLFSEICETSECTRPVENKNLNKVTFHNNCSKPTSHTCESVNVSISDSFVDSANKDLVSQVDGASNLLCFSGRVNNSNPEGSENIELKSSKKLYSENLDSDIVISICDSSVKNNQLSFFQSSSIVCKDIVHPDEMDLVDNITNVNTNVCNYKSKDTTFVNNDSFPMSSQSYSKICGDNDAEKGVNALTMLHSSSSMNNLKANRSKSNSPKMMLHDEAVDEDTIVPKTGTVQDNVLNDELFDNKIIDLGQPITSEAVSLSNSTPLKDTLEKLNDLKNSNQEVENGSEIHPETLVCKIYCSTPVDSNCHDKSSSNLNNSVGNKHKRSRLDLKRKFAHIDCIDEVEEYAPDLNEEKKKKFVKENLDVTPFETNEETISSSISCFEAPAKSILKKWKASSFSSTSYYIVDECGGSDVEDKPDNMVNASSKATVDDFESIFNSLNEELTREGSFNIEGLEKYYSKVLLENQVNDGLKFEINDKLEPINSSVSVRTEVISDIENNKVVAESDDKTMTSENNCCATDHPRECDIKLVGVINDNRSEQKADEVERPNSSSSSIDKRQVRDSEENVTILFHNGEDMAVDDEDILLEEHKSSKNYEFLEYISSDPKENEDNYHPEWQKLGRLTTDEERYTAVRDRWRSLVPPDPNRELTYRHWRKKNKKPPLKPASRNNNHQMQSDNEKTQLCNAVLKMKIKEIWDDLDEGRNHILEMRIRDFENLGLNQDREQELLARRGGSDMDLALLRRQHIEECRDLKLKHDKALMKITKVAEEKVNKLKDASEEALLFQKFYKGFGSRDEEFCLYLTDIQTQELKDIEDMLEQYPGFYQY